MRSADIRQDKLFSTVDTEDRILNKALGDMNEQFEAPYARTGRDSISPEKLQRAGLQMIL